VTAVDTSARIAPDDPRIERIDLPVIVPKKLKETAAGALPRALERGVDAKPAQSTDRFESTLITDASSAKVSAPTDPMHVLAPTTGKGVSARSPANPASGRTAVRRDMPQHDQGWTNACGTTSLSMVLEYFGLPADHDAIDRAIRPWGDRGPGVSPDDVVEYARRAGLQCQQYSEGSVADIEGHVAAGRPVTVLIAHPESGGAHYVNVTAVERTDDGGVFVHIRDPNGFDRRLPEAEFLELWSDARLWQPSKASGVAEVVQAAMPNYNRAYIVYDRADAPPLPQPDLLHTIRDAPAGTVLSGINGLAAGGRMIADGNVGAGALEIFGSALNTVAGGAGYLVGNLAGRNLETLGSAMIAKGQELMEGNALEKAGGFILAALGGVVAALGWILTLIGGAIAALASIPGDLLDRAARSLTERDELRDRLLDRPVDQEPVDTVLGRASLGEKLRMLETLLAGDDDRDREAALVILRASSASERQQLATRLGGAEALVGRFEGDRAAEVRALLGSAEPARSAA